MANQGFTLFLIGALAATTFAVTPAYFPFTETSCGDWTESQVTAFVGGEVGLSAAEISNRLIVADMLSDRADSKTWATTYTRTEYENINFGGGNIVKENKHRFGYPEGEASGGYRNRAIPPAEPYQTWEWHARETMQWAYNYMVQLSGQIVDYDKLFPVKPRLDNPTGDTNTCERRHHATHAELKLLTRLMRGDGLAYGQTVVMAVSRSMCDYCPGIVAHLARNGGRKIAVVTPRKKSKGKSGDQPEYILFKPDGNFVRFRRKTSSSTSAYQCTDFTLNIVPAGIDTYRAPDPNFVPPTPAPAARQISGPISRQVSRQLRALDRNISRQDIAIDLSQTLDPHNLGACPDESNGPGNNCINYMTRDLPKSVACPRPQTITGIHGSFGILNENFPVPVVKSLGSFCDVNTRVPAMGAGGTAPFELKCPADYQLTGFFGHFGDFVNNIGILCRRITDGHLWRSSQSGGLTGGIYVEKECESGAAGRSIGLWIEEAIDGLGLCCR